MKLIKVLESKNKDVSVLNLFNIYQEFEKVVAPQLNYTIRLFDEYTPHDKENHINNLHRISELLLGDELISKLNLTECFILCCSLIGHDWGMAISNKEESEIKNLLNDLESDAEYLDNLLPNEKQLVKKFADEHQNYDTNNKAFWREYIRLTHQQRANFRIQKYFETIDESLGRIIGQVSEGHGLDIEDVLKFEESESVVTQIVNTKCLAIYMRSIDLLDIAKDRTPYKLWKFISPVNKISQIEFKKHLAINPITASEDSVKTIHIHGETKDVDLYYSLEDLGNYVKSQITENIEALKTQGEYSIWFKIDWKIKSIGFEPVNVRFEFDRNSVFKILSSQIYDNDPLVFLRELIQNSVDATRLKEQKLLKLGQSILSKKIEINIITNPNGLDIVEITDSGIGMNEFIIKNYLSKIGKSYYNSLDFNDLGLNFDSISKFGIGILSCFTVANKIEIKTKHLEDINTYSIEINEFDRYFKITKSTENLASSGTTVKVFVNSENWKIDNYQAIEKLDYLNYIETITRLTDIDIELTIDSVKQNISKVSQGNYRGRYLESNFDKYENFNDLYSVKDIIIDDQDSFFHISGIANVAIPKNPYKLYRHKKPGNNKSGISSSPNINSKNYIKWENELKEQDGIFPSLKSLLYSKVYYKGIYLSGIRIDLGNGGLTPPVNLNINIEPKKDNKLSIAVNRSKLLADNYSIADSLNDIIKKNIFIEFYEKLKTNDLKSNLFNLALISDKVNVLDLIGQNLISIKDLPVVYITKDGYLMIKSAGDIDDEHYVNVPRGELNMNIFPHFINQSWNESKVVKINLTDLLGEANLIIPYTYLLYNSSGVLPEVFGKLHNTLSLIYKIVFNNHRFKIYKSTKNYHLVSEFSLNKSGSFVEDKEEVNRIHQSGFIAKEFPIEIKDKLGIIFLSDKFSSSGSIDKVVLNSNYEVAEKIVNLFNKYSDQNIEDHILDQIFESNKFFNLLYHQDRQTIFNNGVTILIRLLNVLKREGYLSFDDNYNTNHFISGISGL